MNHKSLKSLIAFNFVLLFASSAIASEPQLTTITVKTMHCEGCAQKIAARLYTVKGVKEVRVNLDKNALYVIPQEDASLSPLALWEAVVKAKSQPIRLVSPMGTFTKKPKS